MNSGDPDRTGAPFPVEVVGAVAHPGVVQVVSGATVNDAIQASGGPLKDANLVPLDLKKALRPGMKVVVGSSGTAKPVVKSSVVGGPKVPRVYSGAPDALPKEPRPVNINAAGVSEMQFLPGVGEKLAARIVSLRSKIGKFRKPEDLLRVKGIGPKTLSKMRPFVRLK